jgi:hypothetical protein
LFRLCLGIALFVGAASAHAVDAWQFLPVVESGEAASESDAVEGFELAPSSDMTGAPSLTPGHEPTSPRLFFSEHSFPRRQFRIVSDLLFCGGCQDHSQPHVGRGRPLSGTSWLNRPWHFDMFAGAVVPSSLTDQVDQRTDFIGGVRLGKDYDHYWGWEGRLGIALPRLTDGQDPPAPRNADVLFLDAKLMYYPWGDARWRPYTTIGLGLSNYKFSDERGARYAEVLFAMPFGVGVKWQYTRWCALRFDVVDNLTFAGAGVNTLHNVSFTFGFESRFGGRPRTYWPYSPGIRRR